VEPLPIIEHFDVVEQGRLRLFSGLENNVLNTLRFQGRKEALYRGAIVAVAAPAHADASAVVGQQMLVVGTGVLATPVRVVQPACFRPPQQPHGEWQIRAENITYFTDICPAGELSHLFWATGVQRNAHLAQELVILGDGAQWIWNLVAETKAIQIVDWFHACEYLAPVAEVAFKDPEKQAAWLQKVKADLWQGRLEAVIAACAACLKADREDDPAQKAVTYFENNKHRMDYAHYRQQGYQIGSGTIESAAKQIGLLRMKVPGAIWNLDGTRYVAKAGAAYLSNQWPLLAQRRAHLPLAV
jgi:hypothetical protein